MASLYRGFSSANYLNTKLGFTLTDTAIVKRDLLNHLFTRKGSRLKMPNFGTNIPDLIFEPMDDQTLQQISEEVQTVINYDPRVALLDMNVIPLYEYNSVVVSTVIQYLELDMQDRFDINIEFTSPNG